MGSITKNCLLKDSDCTIQEYINQAYELGKSGDQTDQNILVDSATENLPAQCVNYIQNINRPEDIEEKYGTYINYNLLNQKYKNSIEFANVIESQIIADEANYFVNKYGRNFYDNLLDLRSEYFKELDKRKQACDISDCPTMPPGHCLLGCSWDPSNETWIDDPSKNPTDIPPNSYLSNLLSNLQNDTGSYYYDMFSQYLQPVNPLVTYRKIDYRNESHNTIMYINSLMTYLYYILLCVLIVMLLLNNNLYIKERFITFVFLFTLPILYPYFFNLLLYIYRYLTTSNQLHGPKNAFIETNEQKIIDAYNI
jgi:hypothetical protein